MKPNFTNVFTTFLLVAFFSSSTNAQILTQEDSLANNLITKPQATVFSGYGEAKYGVDTQRKSAEAMLRRTVFFVGHKFNKNISFFSEIEIENGIVVGGNSDESSLGGGSVSLEQAFLKFSLNPATYIVGGLLIPRIGIINENHLPTTFNGVDRPYLEEQLIPSTWREFGVGIYGRFNNITGLNYNFLVTNGLNSERFSGSSGIAGGRQLGQAPKGLNLAMNGSLLYYINNFRIQVSGYYGGSTAEEKRVADSLELSSGPFANPVFLSEANVSYYNGGFLVRAIGTYASIQNADEINKAYANNTPEKMYGGYAELAYDVLHHLKKQHSLVVFARYEHISLNAKMPKNGIINEANNKNYLVAGFTYKPIKGIAIKADYVKLATGDFNQALIVTPFPKQVFYYRNNSFINIGLAYNF